MDLKKSYTTYIAYALLKSDVISREMLLIDPSGLLKSHLTENHEH